MALASTRDVVALSLPMIVLEMAATGKKIESSAAGRALYTHYNPLRPVRSATDKEMETGLVETRPVEAISFN
jgi:hypothetical protein